MKQKSSFKILHKSKNRVRFLQPNLQKDSDVKEYESNIRAIEGIKSVRVNDILKSITITYKDGNYESFLNQIAEIKINSKQHETSHVSKSPMIVAAGSLALSSAMKEKRQLLTLSTLFAAYPLFKDGISELFNEGLTSKVLEAMAVGISLSRKDFIAANSTNLMLNIGEYMEETTVHKSDDLIKQLAKPSIKEAWVETTDKNGKKHLNKVFANEIKVGDIVVVGSGETIAIDGYVVEGSASVNQVSMTGEAGAVKKERSDRVMSGTIVEDGYIKIWAELTGEDTSTERIKKYIQNSLNEKSAIGLKATKLADKLVPVTLSLAGLSYFINKDMESVASVLQADYSCALKLATPVAFKSTISKAGKNGILVKGSKSIEALAKADTFVFDKTGTLTKGMLKVVDIISFNKEWTKEQILNLAASVEEHYFHPIAEAIVNAAKQKGFKHMHHDEVEFIVAHGLKTHLSGKEVIIGSRHFLEDDEKISFKEGDSKIKDALDSGYTLLYIAYDKKLLGIIVTEDEIRSNAKDMIAKLKSLNVKEVVMLTGDVESKAKSVAKELGVDRVFANMLPTGKAKVIEQLKNEGRNVVFCGDGINDAPSLMKANVGISMKRGADIAKATADISLLKDDIYAIAQIKEMADKTMSLIDANFKATVGINSAILFGATIGKLSPTTTAFLHNGTTIGLLLNSMKGVDIK